MYDRHKGKPRGPRAIGHVLTELMAKRGIGQAAGLAQLQEVWTRVVGPDLAPFTRVGGIQRGQLEVIVANSVWVQELNYAKDELLARFLAEWRGKPPRGLRFRVGAVR